MKTIYRYLTGAALSGLVCLALALPASAQHRGGGGGGFSGGGGAHFSGGGGGAHFSGGAGFRGGSPAAHPSFNGGNRGFVNGGNRGFVNNGQRGGYAPRAGNAVAQRPYVNGGSRGFYGHGGGYYGGFHAGVGFGAGYYHFNRGYYNTYYLPRIGFSVGFLPYGYYPFYWGDYEYFYSGGLYYEYNDNEYTVVEPPVGAEIATLPSNAQSIVINGTQYYEANGVYYQPVVKDDGTTTYQIAGKDGQLNTNDANNAQQEPQIGDVVQQLPQGTRRINLNGQRYFVTEDGYYYQETVDSAGNKAYKIVGTPSDEPANQQ
jgi:hypothetical protein